MTAKEKLYYLLEHYYTGEYTERDFADQFDFIFSQIAIATCNNSQKSND